MWLPHSKRYMRAPTCADDIIILAASSYELQVPLIFPSPEIGSDRI